MISFQETWKLTGPISEHAMRPDEVEKLYELCTQVPPNGLVVEVGCQLGRSSSVIAQVGRDVGYRSIHVDPYFRDSQYLQSWTALMQSTGHPFCLLCMTTEQAAWHLACLLRGGLNMAFIDGDHERAGVEIDLGIVASKVSRGGFLVAHDFGTSAHPGVYEALTAFVSEAEWDYLGTTFTMGVWRRK